MGRIIGVVLNIFNYIFEQDVRRRKRLRAQFEQQQKQTGQAAEDGLDRFAKKLESWLSEVMGQDEKREQQTLRRLKFDDDGPKTKRGYESVKQHLEETRYRNQSVSKQMHEHLGQRQTSTRDSKNKNFELPGEDPLEQMIYAQLIMGPCKAHQRRKPHRRIY